MTTELKGRIRADREAALSERPVSPFAGCSPSVPFELPGFLVLPENRSAVLAILALLEAVRAGSPPTFSPLLLHGQPGTGKSALLTAVLGALAESSTGLAGRCIPVRELARPDSAEPGCGFSDPDLMDCDLLLLEDVQHLPASASEELCRLLDSRSANGLAVVVTASTGPAELTHLPRRLTSRLGAGLVVQLEPPGFASRRSILAASASTALSAESLDCLASRRGLRAALGGLKNLSASGPAQDAFDLAEMDESLHCAGSASSIIDRVCLVFDVKPGELTGPSRLRSVVLARQVAMHLAREHGHSLIQIGSLFGRDHTTVLHACRRVEAAARADVRLAATVRQLRKDLA